MLGHKYVAARNTINKRGVHFRRQQVTPALACDLLGKSSVLWSEPLGPHAVENVGNADLHVIGVEVKTP